MPNAVKHLDLFSGLVLVLTAYSLTAQSSHEAVPVHEVVSEHGTCAVFMQNAENVAFVIDSVATLVHTSGAVRSLLANCGFRDRL